MSEEVREDVYNDVIYGLATLLQTVENTQTQLAPGVKIAMEYVKAMRNSEV